jgi:hypothetical protein
MKIPLEPLVFLALITVACHDSPMAESTRMPGGAMARLSAAGPAYNEHAQERPFAELAKRHPGFGGFFYDEEGNLVAYTTNPESESASLIEELETLLLELPRSDTWGGTAAEVVIRKGDYTYMELSSWRNTAEQTLTDWSGITYLDLNEGTNRIEIGVVDLTHIGQVREAFTGTGVPADAISFVETGQPEFLKTLQDYSRPNVGGIRIKPYNRSPCTLGFVARSEFGEVFVTNSHCTEEFGQLDGIDFAQPSFHGWPPWRFYIGEEIHDEQFFQCIPGRKCRYSDTALIGVESDAAWAHIARTKKRQAPWQYWHTDFITIYESRPTMQIVDTIYYPVQGDGLNRMGQRSGWAWGFVQNTDIIWFNQNGPELIFGAASINFEDSEYGDSGAPIFYWDEELETAWLAGILFSELGQNTVFSPWGQVLIDYPSLDVATDEPERIVE